MARPVILPADKETVRFGMRTQLRGTKQPVDLQIEGRAQIGSEEIVRVAVPAEDRMQAFLWRHLVPAKDLKALVFHPSDQPPPERIAPELTDELKAKYAPKDAENRAQFSRRQVRGRLRQLEALYQEYLLTDDFYLRKVAECEAAM
jgi:hypothetical protein